jgi:hypothetical protein
MGIKLRPQHLNVLIEALQAVSDYKYQALRKLNWEKFQNEYLLAIIAQIKENDFLLHHPQKNPFNWLIDQLVWSRRVSPGVPLKEGVPLIDTELGISAAEICRAAQRGQKYYDTWSAATTYRDLFTDE